MAAAPAAPIRYRELFQLPQLGVAPASIKLGSVTMESPRCIVTKNEEQISIIETVSKTKRDLPVNVDSAIMNPSANVLGLRQGTNLQIYNLEIRTRMKTAVAPENVVYWRWLNEGTIAMITASAAYHWGMDGDAQLDKQFDLFGQDRRLQILNYESSADGQWLLMQAITSSESSGIQGVLQLHSVEHGKSQLKTDAYGGCFATVTLDGRDRPSILFCFCRRIDAVTKLCIAEVGVATDQAFRIEADIPISQETGFIVSMVPDPLHGVLFAVSQHGFLFALDCHSGKCVFYRRISQTIPFLTCAHTETGGVMTVDRKGRVCLFNIDRDNYVPYLSKTLGLEDLAVSTARRYGLRGAEDVFREQFRSLIERNQIEEAARCAAEAPQGVLRTPETIASLQAISQAALLQYFQFLLRNRKLNELESITLCRTMLSLNPDVGRQRIEKWLRDRKLQNSEELGDLLIRVDSKLACSVYLQANIPSKAVICFIHMGELDKVFEYIETVGYTPNYPELLTQVHATQRPQAKRFAEKMVTKGKMDAQEVVDILSNDLELTTEFLLDYLQHRGDRPEDGRLQTKLLEINLIAAPQVADAIFDSDDYQLTQFDRLLIAKLCERAQLFHRALELYTTLDDIKRVLQVGLGMNLLKLDFLLRFFGDLTPSDALECMRDMLRYPQSGNNLQLVVEIAKRYSEQLEPTNVIALFEEFDSYPGLYLYLGNLVSLTEDPEIIFKFIQATAEVGNIHEVERICRESQFYDPEQVKNFLIDSRVKDPRPLIHLCDRFDFVDELTTYLYTNQMYKFIEVYAHTMNQGAMPKVVGALLDLNAPEDQIRNLINQVRPPQCPVGPLVEEVESRGRLVLLLPWLENRFHEASQDVVLHTALAKIYIDINNNPRHFLTTNAFYDSKVVGEYCESRDPFLAFVAYKRAGGSCDHELVDVSNSHGFFKDQAKYCVERQDKTLWAMVLDSGNEHRQSLIDQVIATALPESRNPNEVSCAIQAFMDAELPNQLIELLERILLSSDADYNFRNNKNLQNLLILSAVKAEPSRVTSYIDRLDNYDGSAIAKTCCQDEYQLYEEAVLIYTKFEKGVEAVDVVLTRIGDIERGAAFAAYWDEPQIWSSVGKAQLNGGFVTEAIESFLKAGDAQYYREVIVAANDVEAFSDLINYLKMAREQVRDKIVDSELMYSFAKVEDMSSLEDLVGKPTGANLDRVGDKCFDEGLFGAAKIIFSQISNYAKLAACLVRLEAFQDAVDAARKANSIQTWKEVCFACVDASKFRLAQICGVNVIVFMDHLHDLMYHYELGGHFAELIALLEQGINLDRAHQGIYTQLGVLYAKYKEQKLYEHINLFWSRLNIPTLLQVCKENLHWREAVFLYTHYDQFENAIDTMIIHSPSCWDHEQFKSIIMRVSNTETFYRAIYFYLHEHPLLLSELLIELSSKLDHKRVVHVIDETGHLPLIQEYLLHVQRANIQAVNEAVNHLYVEDENFEGLRESIDEFDSFDHIALAQRLERHEFVEFRRIAAYLYKRNRRWAVSVELSKENDMWQDAMETVAESSDRDLCESLLRYFVENENCPPACFAACLFTCYGVIRADVVLELSWRYDLVEFCVPFLVQTFREYSNQLEAMARKIEKSEREEAEKKERERDERERMNAVDAAALVPQLPMLTGPRYAGVSFGSVGVGVGGVPPLVGGATGMYISSAPAASRPQNVFGSYQT